MFIYIYTYTYIHNDTFKSHYFLSDYNVILEISCPRNDRDLMPLLKVFCAVCKEHQHHTARHFGLCRGARRTRCLFCIHSRLQNNQNQLVLQSIKSELLGIVVQR